MTIATQKALEVLSIQGLLDSQIGLRELSFIIDNESIICYSFPFRGRLKERYIATPDGIVQIAIAQGLAVPDRKHLIAHALGHHFLHQGSYAHIDGIVQDQQEHQAEHFSAVLLVPPAVIAQIRPTNMLQLAHETNIPLILAERRMAIYVMYNI